MNKKNLKQQQKTLTQKVYEKTEMIKRNTDALKIEVANVYDRDLTRTSISDIFGEREPRLIEHQYVLTINGKPMATLLQADANKRMALASNMTETLGKMFTEISLVDDRVTPEEFEGYAPSVVVDMFTKGILELEKFD